MMDKPEISGNKIIIPSDATYLAEIDEFIEDKLTKADVASSSIADLAISVTEIVNNCIIHGNAGDKNKQVSVAITIDKDQVVVVIKDQGKGFNPDAIPNPLDEANLLNQVGRGIFIVRSLMDSVDFHFGDSGTEVIITKKLNN
jgi:serine/threonine-protein kinase RsbW